MLSFALEGGGGGGGGVGCGALVGCNPFSFKSLLCRRMDQALEQYVGKNARTPRLAQLGLCRCSWQRVRGFLECMTFSQRERAIIN